MKALIALALIAVSGAAFANSACDRVNNDFDGLYCLNKVYQQADTDLNAAFKALGGKLDSAGHTALRQGQLAWMRQRNEQCSMRKGDGFYVDLRCATRTTIERTRFLQDRVRECVSSGCRNSRLSSP
ncbi:lysozyme inhibitor LprI family protein [Cognatilysobacter lacus]|uniref:DUF1311 domain-containing protein n=1 Tax=Cognatilysobacter lacus TaxID=1643323 RepID=A0A5D8Z7Z9_9GAMM|nr:lysozyme inhibitor LprI family protein [Lysobacter lacus]TZF90921.1 DUF1311 domain-containing protein [Lysobacter lacus]